MRLIIAIILFAFLVGCDKKTEYCIAHRFDLTRDFECIKGTDTFYFNVWIDPNPIYTGYPKVVLDSIEKIKLRGYTLKGLNYLVVKNVPCSDCNKIYPLNFQNYCAPM